MKSVPALLFFLSVFASSVLGQDQDGPRFYRETIHPLLEAKCFRCHGAPGEKLKSGFRITNRADLLRGGDFGPSYNEAEPAKSLLLEMVSYKDENHEMPPKAKLASAELEALAKWVEMGVPYDPELEIEGQADDRHGFAITDEDRQWWAYKAVERPAIKAAGSAAIDDLITEELGPKGLKMSDRASRYTLIRRATYDLHGLPPTPDEVDAFVEDKRSDEEAYAALLDRLLAHPAYGEKWARHWLDIVRYAESNGFERDNPKPQIWKYRDYVVNALNNDVPYDQFVIEQLAGDEIENPTRESITATGLHRLMQWDDEPSDRKQHVYDVLADNVQMITEGLLATTVGCARCHDHKADPISQKDFYSFMAFFHGLTHYNTPGTIVNFADQATRERLEKEKREKISAVEKKRADLEGQLRTILTKSGRIGAPNGPAPRFLVRGAQNKEATGNWWHTTKKPTDDWKDVGFKDKSWLRTPKSGFGRPGIPNNPVINNQWTTTDIWVRTEFGLKEIPSKLVLDLYHDEDVQVYLNGTLVYQAMGYIANYKSIELNKEALQALQTGKNVIAFHCKQTGGGQYIDLSLKDGHGKGAVTNVSEAVRVGGGKLRNEVKEASNGRDLVADWQNTQKELDQARKAPSGEPLNAATERGPDGGQLHVHLRGSAHALGDPVVPAFLTVLGQGNEPVPAEFAPLKTIEGKDSSGRRLALAKWIADEKNPLTGRVIMNRLWQHHFGRGIVPSSSDFGRLGEKPTHPRLLDWLASELPRQGWSLKKMHRMIMTSRTYTQNSAPEKTALAADPTNALLWRFPMRRLTAEELRDSLLAVNGRLNSEKRGGDWVCPPLPREVLQTASRPGAGWRVPNDESEHVRRSIYIHVKRSLRHPMMADFDQADTDSPCAVRFVTTVPTQALAMLNSAFVNDQAKHFAARLAKEKPGDLKAQIERAIVLVTQRPAKAEEVAHLEKFAAEIKTSANLDDTATLERVALLALNLNEFVYLD